MVKIGYSGNMKSFRIRVPSGFIDNWKKDEVKEVGKKDSEALLANKYFYLANDSKAKKKKTVKEKTPEVVSEATIKADEPEVEEEKNFDLESADKDELLDYTAVNDIDADYTMTVDELRDKIKKHKTHEESD